ncbi:MAG: sce7726 family protein [Bacillota bacterium]
MKKTRDIDIRISLYQTIRNQFEDHPDTIVIDELQVCYGSARVDIAAINGFLHGYEIKSESDTLERLEQQITYYNKVFDYLYLACSEKYITEVEKKIPSWWGIFLATNNEFGQVDLKKVREAECNERLESFALAQLLKKDEILQVLSLYGLNNQVKKLPKYKLWQYLADSLPIQEIQENVKRCLKTRENWRSNLLNKLCDDL